LAILPWILLCSTFYWPPCGIDDWHAKEGFSVLRCCVVDRNWESSRYDCAPLTSDVLHDHTPAAPCCPVPWDAHAATHHSTTPRSKTQYLFVSFMQKMHKKSMWLLPLTLVFNGVLEVVEIQVRAKLYKVKCSGSWVTGIALMEKMWIKLRTILSSPVS